MRDEPWALLRSGGPRPGALLARRSNERLLGTFAVTLLTGCDVVPVSAPEDADMTPEQRATAELGQALFFDPALSRSGEVSCASCHRPEHGGAEPLATSVGLDGGPLPRNAPSVWSAALSDLLFWDGRSSSLEEQVLIPLLAPDEMGGEPDAIVEHLSAAYANAFAEAGLGAPSLDGLARAIAAYERRLIAPGRVDRFLLGDREALSDLEQEGLRLFRAQCVFCHGGDGVGGDELALLGEENPWPADRRADLGVGDLTGNPADSLTFRVPSLRHAASTPPYFHDGSVATLEEAVDLMGWHQQGVRFSSSEVGALVAFLQALDGAPADRWRYPPAPTVR
jgi:cytochrome c peroxidase